MTADIKNRLPTDVVLPLGHAPGGLGSTSTPLDDYEHAFASIGYQWDPPVEQRATEPGREALARFIADLRVSR